MNGFAEKGLDEDAFGEKSTMQKGLQTFDAFRMSAGINNAIYIYINKDELLTD